MIISKPKGNTLFALGLFFLICITTLGYTLYNFLSYDNRYWYQYIIFIVVTPVALVVLVKTIKGYKIIKLGKGKLSVNYPFIFKKQLFGMQDLVSWSEEVIKTPGANFKELKMKFLQDNVSLSNQENGEYPKIHSYLKKKHPKKFLKSI